MSLTTLALAKGRTAKATIKLLEKANIHFPDFHEKSRKLIFYDTTNNIKMLFVKAIDVPTYVTTGAADIGIVGKDNILESNVDVYEMLDLNIGKCQFVIASKTLASLDEVNQLTVASKYTKVAENYFSKQNISIETIKLNGSVELAPLIGMADVILDIVETGTTLKENGLKPLKVIEDISTRLIVNKASFATKTTQIQTFMQQLQKVLGD
ncbi:MAG TPA: ATP phosphoribosyltransferase [Bacillota bacterium]|nr:ATP phosphoribosyltransferase [Bacillota bacterium]